MKILKRDKDKTSDLFTPVLALMISRAHIRASVWLSERLMRASSVSLYSLITLLSHCFTLNAHYLWCIWSTSKRQRSGNWKIKKVNANYRGLELKGVIKEVHNISYQSELGQGVLHYLRYPVFKLVQCAVKKHIIIFMIFHFNAHLHF